MAAPVAGCGVGEGATQKTSSPTPSTTKNAQYETVEELRNAAMDAGLSCSPWKRYIDAELADASQGGTCGDPDGVSGEDYSSVELNRVQPVLGGTITTDKD